ncbi:hypothetical protein [Klebsiella pneumoniae]|uniref:hypothetical protein n=1 Tax=Klebsiella pneumoniae TaxID=573 RepID=UPI003315A5FD
MAPAEPPYEEEEVVDALLGGEKLSRLSGLRVLHIGDSFFVHRNNSTPPMPKRWMRCVRYTSLGQGRARQRPAESGVRERTDAAD